MLPKIAITMGDPAGIGPEICTKLLESGAVRDLCEPYLIGDVEVLGFSDQVLDQKQITRADFVPGKVSAKCGAAAYAYILEAIRLCQTGAMAAMVTAPIHKEALHLAGVPFPGHTEILVSTTHAQEHVMMLTSEEITSALVTAHVGYADVPGKITEERVFQTIRLTANAMRRIREKNTVRLTVCGLNPHAGEHGLFGRGEEETILIPAMERARKHFGDRLQMTGPLPPDTAFLPAKRRETDAYICMTHDQGLIPMKMLAFDSGVNVTLGLPIIRTSVDHGTAMDIVGTGKADFRSLISAVRLAVKLARKE
ncbi:MAG: 4-hydroxythreonine-4-phosphate dehydrogenase PdxA [Planctomycetia bacterium]|nr:4-hydroxythreonine-4-phosphate dehydrogenase PdxA [Planctomycetia bacterium]